MLVAFATLTLLTGLSALAADTSSLRPPKGAKVAIVVFEDLQCPDCGRAEPLLEEAAKTYKIPIVRHDFPLPQHNWSFDAHMFGRYFDTKSPELGEEWRRFCLKNQASITKHEPAGRCSEVRRAAREDDSRVRRSQGRIGCQSEG